MNEIYETGDADDGNNLPKFNNVKGKWKSARNATYGYGVYTYPNGCQYNGYFANGLFNGFGTFKFPQPIGIRISGVFENGKLVELSDLQFSDGLSAKAKIHADGIRFDKWKYCTPLDRRFFVERLRGILPVGPVAHLTANDPPIPLNDNTYDAGDGIFHKGNDTMVNKLKNIHGMANLRHIYDKEEKQWILQNCRQKNVRNIYMPDRDLGRKIIADNVENQEKWQLSDYGCSCSYYMDLNKEYFTKLCENPTKLQLIRNFFLKKELERSLDSDLSSIISDISSFDNTQVLIGMKA